VNDKITYQYEYIDSGGWMTTTNIKDAVVYYTHNTMVLFLNQYMTVAKRNEIVHNLPNIYK
jgi:hypothetical protein